MQQGKYATESKEDFIARVTTEEVHYAARAAFKLALNTGILNVDFQKADGSRRKMFCTTSPAILDKHGIEVGDFSTDKPHKETDNVHVFDLDAAAWRSVRFDRVYEYSVCPQTKFSMSDQ